MNIFLVFFWRKYDFDFENQNLKTRETTKMESDENEAKGITFMDLVGPTSNNFLLLIIGAINQHLFSFGDNWEVEPAIIFFC